MEANTNNGTEWYVDESEKKFCRVETSIEDCVFVPAGWYRIGNLEGLALTHQGLEEIEPKEVGFKVI